MDDKKLLIYYNDNKLKSKKILEKENDETYQEILKLTEFLNNHYDNVTFKQRIWHIQNNDYNLQLCKACGAIVKFNKTKLYNLTCCKKCNNDYRNTQEFKSKLYNKIDYNIIKDKIKQTCIEKYGSENYAQSNEFKDLYGKPEDKRTPEDKRKQTCIEKYGVDNPSKIPETHQKALKTNNEKYGKDWYMQTEEWLKRHKEKSREMYSTDFSFQSEEIKEKSKQTCIKKYGTNNPFQSEEIKEKSKQTCIKKYGTDDYSKTEIHQEANFISSEQKFKQKLEDDNFTLLGYEYVCYKGNHIHSIMCPICKKEFEIHSSNVYWRRNKSNHELCTLCNPLYKNYSIGEKQLLDYISSIYKGEIISNDRSIINPYELDIYLPKLNLGIEFNGDYWHRNPKLYKSNEDSKVIWEKDKLKKNLCKEKEIVLVVVWENDWENNKEKVKEKVKNRIEQEIAIKIKKLRKK